MSTKQLSGSETSGKADRRDDGLSEGVTDSLCCPPLFGPDLDEADAADLAATLKALADPVRLRLISIISRSGEVCTCDLPELLGRSQPTISHHLSILAKAGLVNREQRGKWAWFSIDQRRLDELRAALSDSTAH